MATSHSTEDDSLKAAIWETGDSRSRQRERRNYSALDGGRKVRISLKHIEEMKKCLGLY